MKTKFEVTPNGKGGYKISIGTGKTYNAMDLNAVGYALQHYFGEDMFDNKYDYKKHIEHNRECNCCPLCDGD